MMEFGAKRVSPGKVIIRAAPTAVDRAAVGAAQLRAHQRQIIIEFVRTVHRLGEVRAEPRALVVQCRIV
jgi:hypothetical protein